MDGWFLSRSTVRSIRSRKASRQAGSSLGLPAQPLALEAVRFEVALEDDPEAHFVGEVEQARVRRVVAGADRVDVELLHQGQVGAGEVLVEDAAAVGMGLVPVHAVEDDAPAVDQEPVADDLHRAEPEAERDASRPALATVASYSRGISADHGSTASIADRGNVRRGVPCDVHTQLRHGERHREGVAGRGDFGVDRAGAGIAGAAERGAQPDVVDAACRPGLQRHVAEDARQPPLVLVLEVARRRPLVHAHGQHVRSRAHRVGDVELLGQPAPDADADRTPLTHTL